jgi:hypothetical protein
VVTAPVAETVATLLADEVQVTLVVRFWLVPSLYSPVAVSWSDRPAATEDAVRVIWIDSKVGCVTVLGADFEHAGSRPRHKSAIDTWNFFINFSPEFHQ